MCIYIHFYMCKYLRLFIINVCMGIYFCVYIYIYIYIYVCVCVCVCVYEAPIAQIFRNLEYILYI